MKLQYAYILFFILGGYTATAQVNTASGTWSPIGNVNLVTLVAGVDADDADNGDGVADGAIIVDGQTAVSGLGAAFTFGGAMILGEEINISTHTYNRNSSFVSFTVQLFNLTNSRVLVTSPTITIDGNDKTPVNTILSYTAVSADVGDVLQARYIRTGTTSSANSTARDFAIDNLILTGQCPFTVTPDLALMPSNSTIEAEIINAVSKFSDAYLGSTTPTSSQLATAETAYNALNINVSGSIITGNAITGFGATSFLRVFARHLKFNPGDTNIKAKANNTVWWVSKEFCSGNVPIDIQLYAYEDFARPSILLNDFLEAHVKSLFEFTLYEHSVAFEHFWQPTYDATYQQNNDAIISDVIFNIGDVLLAYSLWQNTPDERYRYMRAYKRYLDRFFSYTIGTAGGIKPDGTGFHHWVAYNNYMYAFNTAAEILFYLSDTPFQVGVENYKVFRDAFYAQFIQSNDYFFMGGPTGTQRTGTQALSTAGRNPQTRINPLSQSTFKILAIEGGKILGLSTADPALAGMYNRIYGVEAAFNNTLVAPFETGFFQFNHAMAGAFRKNNWLVFNKGFSNSMWGAEIYGTQNRYGRYQSYGALEVIYPGDKLTGNGYDHNTWDWNFNPGTTVIKLPWANLHAERGRIDEEQQKRFVGTLNLKNKNSELLNNNHADFGMFAMDFREKEGQGFDITHASENHNNSFTFKKSNFYFDDIIVCLGSGISNDDASNQTITTLFQRLDNKGIGVNVNGTNQTSTGLVNYSGSSNNWLISNYGTGFYLVSGNDNLLVQKELQQTPNQNEVWPVNISSNATATYYTGYINHGTNPSNKNYEYILIPQTNAVEMQTLHTVMQSSNKPYIVHQKNENAHIVEHMDKNIFGYAFFNANTNLNYNYVKAINASCLVMTQFSSANNTMLVSINNPDIGFESRSNMPSVQVTRNLTLQGQWSLSTSYPSVQVVSSNANETVIQFTLVDGLTTEILLNSVTLSIQDLEKTSVTIYPNPTNSILNVKFLDNNIQIKLIRLTDVSGKVIYNALKAKEINVTGFSKGFYFLSIETNLGATLTKKVIIN